LKNSSILIYSINFICDHPEYINYNYASIKEHIASNQLDIDALSSSIISKIICNIRSKVLPNHELIHNAGSFFKNPIVSEDLISFSHFSREELIIWLQGDGLIKVGAARLIELIKDKLIPSANVSISDTHNLVLITNGKATQREVLEFSGQIQSLVKDFFNLDLEIEPTVIEA
jgi:UDP-N-acetylmuramate dehydrogenase